MLKNNTFLYILSILVISISAYYYYNNTDFNTTYFIILIIQFFISYLVSSYVLENFTFSKNAFVRFLQKFIIYNLIIFIILSIIVYILSNLNLLPVFFCDIGEVDTGKENVSIESTKDKNILTIEAGQQGYKFTVDKKALDTAVYGISTVAKPVIEKKALDLCVAVAVATTGYKAYQLAAKANVSFVPRLGILIATTAVTAFGITLALNLG